MKYRIGLDIGIGSIGWAAVSGEKETARIEDFGVRIFESGEKDNGKSRTSQERRGFRGSRRLIRRRHYRKILLKNHFENIGLLNSFFNDDLALCSDEDVYELKYKALDEKLSVAQLYKCLAHTCNHRGYRDFYEVDEDTNDDESVNKKAVHDFESRFNESNKRTVSEYLFCECREGDFVRFRNRNFGKEDYLLINRKLLKDEVEKILKKQSEYYPELNKNNIESIIKIIFNQRDFEDGPGNPNDKFRRYKGFLETLGTCPFYKDETRGFRSTIISDVFAVTNTLSQYRFVNKETGEYDLPKEIAEELVTYLLDNANLTMTEVKNILKAHNYVLLKSENSDDKALSKAIKYLKIAKKSIEEAGLVWQDFINEEQFDISAPSKLHQIGEIISKFQTPSRRRKEFEALSFATPELIKAFSNKKISGTANASYKYMCEAIDAFKNGDIYGNFQANFNKNTEEVETVEKAFKLATKHIDDKEIRNNPVVFKSINETRKLVNAIIDVYGSPETIVVEVASDLNRSFAERMEILKHQKANEKTNDTIKQKISELLNIDVAEVKPIMIDKYKLYEQQEGKSLYSGDALGDIIDVLKDENHIYEVDHIVPYSLILDNTLNNKALVYYKENQLKGQKTPLMCDFIDKDEFIKRVNYLYTKNVISAKKLKYLKLESIYTQEAKDLLSNWKSRNINDTRYITKYIISIFRKYLKFNGDKKQPVFAVKGGMTSKFRKIWLNDCMWGDEEKNRDTYLNHAVDAVVVANLTPAYIEIASDSIKLRSIYYKHRKTLSGEYNDYLNKCVDKMEKYYGFSKEYTQKLLRNTERVPSFIPRLSAEIQARFKDDNIEDFNDGIKRFYGDNAEFIVQPQMPITSHKQNKKFKGAIADSNLIRVATIDGNTYKIKRFNVKELKKSQFEKLYTNDLSLIKTLEKIFEEYDTVEKYMKANNIDKFITISGQPIYKVSVIETAVSNYYKKTIDDNNYGYLGGLKYYCIEVYKDVDGKTKTYGIRYVDMVKKNKKLYQKQESLPADYSEHMTYLFPNDYIKVYNGKNELKFEGFYKSVHAISRSLFYFQSRNLTTKIDVSITNKDTVKKYNINLLGKSGGEIKCSEPWSLISAKK